MFGTVAGALLWIALVIVAQRPRDPTSRRTLAWVERARDEAMFGLGVVTICAGLA
jgi:hypothetical protein